MLPPDITVKKIMLSQCWVYVFRHKELGELGRLRLQGLGDGNETLIACEVAGDPDDPMTAARQAVLEPLTRKYTDELERLKGRGRDVIPPPPPPKEPKTLVESRLLQCVHCDAFVAMLIFAENAYTPDRLEDYARMMYNQVVERNLPAWVIGSPLNNEPMPKAPHYVLKIWPAREPVYISTPAELNIELYKLQEQHCDSE